MLDALIQQLVRSFERSHQAPFLYASSICITEYGQDPSKAKLLYDMVAAMATTAFSFLRTLEELTNHPDVVEEFFYLMGRMMSHCPDPLARSPLLQSLFQCAVVGMQLDHHGANKGTIKFLEHTISYGLSLREQNKPECQAALEQVLSQEGHSIVANLARAMMGDLPAYSNQIPEILWKLNLLCPGLLSQWLTAAFDSAALPERAKNDFMGALDTGLARDEFSLAVRAFQSACARERRLRKAQRRS
jgi:transportin-3